MTKRRTSRPIQPKTLRSSPKTANELSDHRKTAVENEINSGVVKEGVSYHNSNINKNITPPKPGENISRGEWIPVSGSQTPVNQSTIGKAVVAHSHSYMVKTGATCGGSSGGGSGSSPSVGGVDRMAPEVYSPLFTMANLNLPRDRLTVNAWNRNFYSLHPIVRNAITLHATYPISKLMLKCHDKIVLRFFEDMVEEMGLMQSIGEVALEFFKLGEAFPYAELNENSGKWSKVIVQNPDYISVRKTVLSGEPIIALKPDSVLQRLVMSSSPADVELRRQIPENIIYHIRKGQNIPLDNFNVSHLKMLASPYDIRGTSIIVSVFKDLILYDKIRECKFAQADGMINPITLVLVGGNTDGEYRATDEDLNHFKEMFEQAQYDKDFKLITHAGIDVKRVGASGQIIDVGQDMELIIKNIYTGLMVPPAIVDAEGTGYASASIGLEVLRQRYFNFREMMAQWLTNKIFAPISEIQGFYEYKNGEKRLVVPDVEWNKMNLYDLADYIGTLTGLVANKQVSIQTLYKSLGLNYEDERVKMRQEMINDAIKLKEEQSLNSMTISELRTLDPEKEVFDPIDNKEREPNGSPAGGEMGGGDMGMGGMDLGMGGDLGGLGGDMSGGGLGELAPPPVSDMGGGGFGEGGGGVPPAGI